VQLQLQIHTLTGSLDQSTRRIVALEADLAALTNGNEGLMEVTQEAAKVREERDRLESALVNAQRDHEKAMGQKQQVLTISHFYQSNVIDFC
jgi:hypothetical protein